jgi:ribonuclease HII
MAAKARKGAPATYERRLWGEGYARIAGVDEVGRGAWAGPVVAAAVIMPPSPRVKGLADSKQVAAAARETLFDAITEAAQAWAVGVVDSRRVDEINVLRATFEAMEKAVAELATAPDFILVDGRDVPRFPLPYQAVLHGDALVYSIAAASIVAKVWRDRIMASIHGDYPHYCFHENKGYGTRAHQQALREHGACPHHRLSYAPLKALSQEALPLQRE